MTVTSGSSLKKQPDHINTTHPTYLFQHLTSQHSPTHTLPDGNTTASNGCRTSIPSRSTSGTAPRSIRLLLRARRHAPHTASPNLTSRPRPHLPATLPRNARSRFRQHHLPHQRMADFGPTHTTTGRAGALRPPDNATGGARRAARLPVRGAARGDGTGGRRGAVHYLCGPPWVGLPRGHDGQQLRDAAVGDGDSFREPPASQDPHRPRRPHPQVRYGEASCWCT